MNGPLKKVTIYFTEEEYASLQAIADDEEVTLSAVVRAKLGLVYKRRGAPKGNTNRRARAKVSRLDRWEKVIDAGPPPMTLLKDDERDREF